MSSRRWVQRNEDKPHRCPECHAVATWDNPTYGPRTRLVCPRDCNVQWRTKNRLLPVRKIVGPMPFWYRLVRMARR